MSLKSWQQPKAHPDDVTGKVKTIEPPEHKPRASADIGAVILTPNDSDLSLAKAIDNAIYYGAVKEKKQQDSVDTQEYTGSSVSYYKVHIANPTTLPAPYDAECNDIIEALDMTFAEGNGFKALWRRCAARKGLIKKGYTDGLYDAEKLVFFAERMVVLEKAEK